MRHDRHDRAAGYSLIELIAAMSIFSLGVLGTLEVFGTSMHASSLSLSYTQAVFLAQQLMEETLAEGIFYAKSDSGDFGGDYASHSWQLDIEETNQKGLYQVNVVVEWTERGLKKEYALTSLATGSA